MEPAESMETIQFHGLHKFMDLHGSYGGHGIHGLHSMELLDILENRLSNIFFDTRMDFLWLWDTRGAKTEISVINVMWRHQNSSISA